MSEKPRKHVFRMTAQRLAPDKGSAEEVYNLQRLLGNYGFLSGDYRPQMYDEATRSAVAQFQSFYRIYPDEDGVCDEQTIRLLNQPRCGVPDLGGRIHLPDGRLAPFVTVGAKWPRNDLSFKFLNSTPDLSEQRQRDIIREAFNRWSQSSALVFREVPLNDSAALSVAFHRGSHGDGSPFDDAGGPDGNTLAHAFFPPPVGGPWAGSLHFDEFEAWKDGPGGAGTRLHNVALHEIGHLLGLAHSQDTNAIMYAYYGEDRNDLRPDDMAGVQSLYGASLGAPTPITPGQRIRGQLAQTGAIASYQVTLQNKLLVSLQGASNQDFDLYVRFGSPVDLQADAYDAVSYGVTAEEFVTIEKPQRGTYYILLHSYRGSGSYELQAEVA